MFLTRTRRPLWLRILCVSVLLYACATPACGSSHRKAAPLLSDKAKATLSSLRKIWDNTTTVDAREVRRLRDEAWSMFDYGFSNYMHYAFPKDNLLPISCQGEDWQGGMAITLIDSLDTLLLMNRRADIDMAVDALRRTVHFDKDVRVHVFETTIRVLGGLCSGHVLLARDPSLVPSYDGLFLRLAVELADRLLPAFRTPSGLPFTWVHLRDGPLPEDTVTCTACAGTLLLEFGLLSHLTGNPVYLEKADAAARAMYRKRSRLGLVGSHIHVDAQGWASKESTIGPGTDSYFEYLLKAYLMFGKQEHLDMFVELYVSTMRHMQIPGTFRGYSWLVDVHMDSGKLTKPWVSSLGAFWPGMQALVGQTAAAVDLHSNFTAAWRTYGWLPELFGIDLSKVHPEDPGYNLRPEHIESTFMLHSLTGDPSYLSTARNIQSVLQHSKVRCGYARISNVETAEVEDLMESYFLSETVKYLYLMFSDTPLLVDYFVLSTEGHLLPAFATPADSIPQPPRHSAAVYRDCAAVCDRPPAAAQSAAARKLRAQFPLIAFRDADADVIRGRRCSACLAVTDRMRREPAVPDAERARVMNLRGAFEGRQTPRPGQVKAVLSQVVCLLHFVTRTKMKCSALRAASPLDALVGLPDNAVLLQLAQVLLPAAPTTSVVIAHADVAEPWAMHMDLGPASFGPPIPNADGRCLQQLLLANPRALLRHKPQAGKLSRLRRTVLSGVGGIIDKVAQRVNGMQPEAGPRPAQHAQHGLSAQHASGLQQHQGAGAGQQKSYHTLRRHAPQCPVSLYGIMSTSDLVGNGTSPAVNIIPDTTAAHGDAAAASSSSTSRATADSGGGDCRMPGVVTRRLVRAKPADGCTVPVNARDLRGAVAVVVRGSCSFQAKVYLMEVAGAAGVIVLNNMQRDVLMNMAGDDSASPPPGIPSGILDYDAAEALQRWMQRYSLNATLLALPADVAAAPRRPALQLGRRVDLVIPHNAQGWLMKHVSMRALDTTTMFEHVLADQRAMQLLMDTADGHPIGTT